jgi:hypothetical protein
MQPLTRACLKPPPPIHPQGVVLKVEEGVGSFVDVGLDRTALVEGVQLRPNARVTLRLGETERVKFMEGYGESMLLGEVGARGARGSRVPYRRGRWRRRQWGGQRGDGRRRAQTGRPAAQMHASPTEPPAAAAPCAGGAAEHAARGGGAVLGLHHTAGQGHQRAAAGVPL